MAIGAIPILRADDQLDNLRKRLIEDGGAAYALRLTAAAEELARAELRLELAAKIESIAVYKATQARIDDPLCSNYEADLERFRDEAVSDLIGRELRGKTAEVIQRTLDAAPADRASE